jgi:hypothetical protein
MPNKKQHNKVASHYSVSGSAERKRLARSGRAPASNAGGGRQKSGMDLFRETMFDKKR